MSSQKFLRDFSDHLRGRPFEPLRWLKGAHSQTLAASQWRRRFPWGWKSRTRESVVLANGAQIEADLIRRPQPSPTLVVLHGMTGGADSDYMQGLSHKAWHLGWSSILPNLYNRNLGLQNRSFFHAGASREVDEVLNTLTRRHQVREVYLVGVSLGGNMLLKLLGEWGEDFPDWVKAAGVISPLCDLSLSCAVLERPSNRFYQAYFSRRLRNIVRPHKVDLESMIDMQSVLRSSTLREFDEHFTAPLAGFKNAFDYYEKASARRVLDRIRVPTVVLHSKDDPLLPWQPLAEVQGANPALLVHLTSKGGHLGYFEQNPGSDLDRRWAENRLLEFFESVRNSGSP